MQMHVNLQTPPAVAVEQTIELFAELGEVHITEMDMSIYTNDTDTYTEVPEDVLVWQGYRYKELFEVFARQAENIETVTFWGMADDHTWLKTWPITRINLPLPFDEALQAKYAYWGIVEPDQLPIWNVKVDIGKGTPEIDGDLDDLWGAQPWIPLETSEDLAISYQTRWDENNLYVFLMAEGSGYDVEAVDVFIDTNNGKTETVEGDDLHLTVQGGACVDCDGVVVAEAGDDSRHALEMAIPLSAAAAVGDELGFDVRITRASMDEPISWNDRSHSQDSDTSKYGVLKLIEAARMTTAVYGTPIIDGEEDEVWAGAEEVETAVWVLGDSGSTATAKTMWDDEYLYAYVTVTDALLSKAASNPWEQDSIEIYVDQNNAKTTVYQPDDGQYRVNFDNEQSFLGGATAEKIRSASRLIEDGYVIELAIQLDAIQPQEGMIIGFDFQVNNDENGNGVRDTVATWNDPTHLSYQNTSRLGLLLFGE
jgi:endo-1,4-beta-xylanase